MKRRPSHLAKEEKLRQWFPACLSGVWHQPVCVLCVAFVYVVASQHLVYSLSMTGMGIPILLPPLLIQSLAQQTSSEHSFRKGQQAHPRRRDICWPLRHPRACPLHGTRHVSSYDLSQNLLGIGMWLAQPVQWEECLHLDADILGGSWNEILLRSEHMLKVHGRAVCVRVCLGSGERGRLSCRCIFMGNSKSSLRKVSFRKLIQERPLAPQSDVWFGPSACVTANELTVVDSHFWLHYFRVRRYHLFQLKTTHLPVSERAMISHD